MPGRVYIIWENDTSGEKYLQILDISEKPVLSQEHTQGSAQAGMLSPPPGDPSSKTTVSSQVKKELFDSDAGTPGNNQVSLTVVKPLAKVRGVMLIGKKRALKASWWYTSGCSGYQVVCSRSGKFARKNTVYTKGVSVKVRGMKKKRFFM